MRAKSRNVPAKRPFVIHCFAPVIVQPSPSGSALVRSDPASDPADPRWDWVTIAPVRALRFVPLDELKRIPELAGSRLLARGNRLSVLPLSDEEFAALVSYADRGRLDALPGAAAGARTPDATTSGSGAAGRRKRTSSTA